MFITMKCTSCSSCKKINWSFQLFTRKVLYMLKVLFLALKGIMRHFVYNTMHFNCIISSLIAVNYPCVCSAPLLEPTTWLLEPLHTMAAAKRFLMWTPAFIKSLVWYHLFTLYSLSSHWTDRVPWQIPKKTVKENLVDPTTPFLNKKATAKILHTFCFDMDHCLYISSFKPKHWWANIMIGLKTLLTWSLLTYSIFRWMRGNF